MYEVDPFNNPLRPPNRSEQTNEKPKDTKDQDKWEGSRYAQNLVTRLRKKNADMKRRSRARATKLKPEKDW